MPSVKSVLAASAIAFFTSASGHMILLTPPPYGNPSSSPLDPSGSDFPCKSTSGGGTTTNMAIGSKQQLSFKGSAVHGGGSCQVSVTTDNPATKNSKWMVIHSIEGGCPARGAGGNLGNDPGMLGKDRYDYTIPQGLTPGKYTLAWTWFNKIGNREMYMNCATVQISGGSGKRDIPLNETYSIPELSERATPNFPAMFVANIPATDCTTTESTDLAFPDPGSSVEKAGTGQTAPPKGPKCGTAGTKASTSGDSAGAGSSGSGASGAAPNGATGGSGSGAGAAPAASSATAGSAGDSGSGSGSAPPPPPAGGVSPAAGGNGSSAGGAPDSQPKAASVAAPSSGASSSGSGSGSGSGSSASAAGASTGSCSQPGQSICSPDGKQIGTCTQGNTVTWIPVASGTKCQGGVMVYANSKRSVRFPTDYKFGQ